MRNLAGTASVNPWPQGSFWIFTHSSYSAWVWSSRIVMSDFSLMAPESVGPDCPRTTHPAPTHHSPLTYSPQMFLHAPRSTLHARWRSRRAPHRLPAHFTRNKSPDQIGRASCRE